MIKVLIADDEALAREKLERWVAEQPDMAVTGCANDGLAAAHAIERLQPDVAFLDIQMPALSGLQVAAQLEASSAPLIVFVTAFDEHAVKAFELNAIDYLLKPYDQDRLLRTLDRVRERLRSGQSRSVAVSAARAQYPSCERLLVPDGERLQLIDAVSIEWLEADDNYVQVNTAVRRYLLRRTLQDLLVQLGERQFVRIHKSAAVNLAAIASPTPPFKGDYDVQLRSGHTLVSGTLALSCISGRTGPGCSWDHQLRHDLASLSLLVRAPTAVRQRCDIPRLDRGRREARHRLGSECLATAP